VPFSLIRIGDFEDRTSLGLFIFPPGMDAPIITLMFERAGLPGRGFFSESSIHRSGRKSEFGDYFKILQASEKATG
jgi:hypothetical protein